MMGNEPKKIPISNKVIVDLSTTANNLEAKVERQAKEIRKLKVLLKGRDDYIVACGFWSDFTQSNWK